MTNREADGLKQLYEARANQPETQLEFSNENEEAKRREAEKAAREQERASERAGQKMQSEMEKTANKIAGAVSSAVSGAVSSAQSWVSKALGIDAEGEQRAEEGVRRMAAVAIGGLSDVNIPELMKQLKGVDAASAFVQAVTSGNDAAVKEEARKLATKPIAELFDANMMANDIEQKLRANDLQGQLNQRVQKILSEKGLDVSIESISSIATGTQEVATKATQGVSEIGSGAATAGAQVKTAFDTALPSVNTLIKRLEFMAGVLDVIVKKAGLAGGSISAMNPPQAPADAGNAASQSQMGGVPFQ